MKKLFSLFLMLCLWVPLCGFTSASTASILYSSGVAIEAVNIRYSQEDAQKIGQTFESLDLKMKIVSGALELAVKAQILEKLANTPNVNVQETAEKISVDAGVADGGDFSTLSVVITYANRDVYDIFLEDVKAQTTTTLKETLFLRTYTTTSPVRVSVFENLGQKQNLYEFVLADVKSRLESYFGSVDTLFNGEYSYTYATSVARLHTDADLVEIDPETNLKYYTWDFSADEDSSITIWQIRPNAVSWYVLALLLTAGFGGGLWLYTRKKKQKTQSENS